MLSLPKALTLVVAITALSACQSSPLTSWLFKRSDRSAATLVENDGSRSLAEGRAALQEGRPAAAIIPLRISLLDPSTRPQASNALGVAYAQMGREDLAEQYFKSAIAAAPADTRYVANLLRLQQAVLARKAQSDAARLAMETGNSAAGAKEEELLAASPEPRVKASHLPSTIERRSRAEVFIASATTQSAPSATVAYLERPGSSKAPTGSKKASETAPTAAPKARVVENPFGNKPSGSAIGADRP